MTRPMKGLWLFLLGLLGLYGGAASAATEAVLCNDGIKGESVRKGAAECIDVLAWSWGLSAPQVAGGGGPGGGGVPSLEGFTVTKYIDSSSENLFSFVATQNVLDGIVEFRDYRYCGSTCGSSEPYLTVHMRNARVSSQSMGGSGGDDRHVENVTFVFGEVSYCYRSLAKDGSLGAEQCFAYSAVTGGPISPF